MRLTEKLSLLNNVDLSKLKQRIDEARAALQKEIDAKAVDPNRQVTPAEIQQAASSAGLSVEELLDALTSAKRMGLL